MSLIRIFNLLSVITLVAARIQTALDKRDNSYPPNTPNIPEINGPFTITVVARFDDIAGGYYQRLVDFGNGPGVNNILLGQVRNTTKIRLKVWANDGVGTTYKLDVSNAITEGTTDTWEARVDAAGLLSIKKNGVELGQTIGAVPLPAVRSQKLIGKSHWSSDDDFIGAILGLKVVNHNDPQDFRSLELLNLLAQIVFDRFVASTYVRFDNLDVDRYDQRIFELSSGPQQNVVTFSQYSNTADVVLEIRQDSNIYQCPTTSGTSIVLGEMALWRVQVTSGDTSYYRIEKNGVELVECAFWSSGSPKDVVRQTLLIGESNFAGVLTQTQGVILGLRIDDAK